MLKIIVGKNKIKGAEELKWESVSSEELASLASTQAMFGGAQTFLLVGALNSERKEEFLKLADVFAESPHMFIFEEDKLLKAPTVALEKAGATIEVIKKVAAKERGFDPFGLTFALAAHDKKKLWLGLTQALRAGEKPEAIAGLLHWKVRQELERATGKKREDLVNLSRRLVFMYHDSHRGAGSLELLLEQFALTL
jgi:DNA polymerase III delta subunit